MTKYFIYKILINCERVNEYYDTIETNNIDDALCEFADQRSTKTHKYFYNEDDYTVYDTDGNKFIFVAEPPTKEKE